MCFLRIKITFLLKKIEKREINYCIFDGNKALKNQNRNKCFSCVLRLKKVIFLRKNGL